MPKYPSVILFRYNKYSHIDNFIESNKPDFMCSIHITSDIEELNKLFNPNYHLLVTYGDSYDEYHNENERKKCRDILKSKGGNLDKWT